VVKRDRINLDESLIGLGNRARHLDKFGVVVFDAGVCLFEDHGSRHSEVVLGCGIEELLIVGWILISFVFFCFA